MKQLQRAFSRKEKLESALSSLEDMKSKGEIDDEQYDTMKERYTSFLAEANADIEQMKREFQSRVTEQENLLSTFEQDRKNLKVRFRVGELNAEQYRREEQKLQKRIQDCEAKVAKLSTLAASTSSQDVGGFIDAPVDRSAVKKGIGNVELPGMPSLDAGSWSLRNFSIELSPGKRPFHITAGVLLCIYALFNIAGAIARFLVAGGAAKTGSFLAGLGADSSTMEAHAAILYVLGFLFILLCGAQITSAVGLFCSSTWAAGLTLITAGAGIILEILDSFETNFDVLTLLYLAIGAFSIFAVLEKK